MLLICLHVFESVFMLFLFLRFRDKCVGTFGVYHLVLIWYLVLMWFNVPRHCSCDMIESEFVFLAVASNNSQFEDLSAIVLRMFHCCQMMHLFAWLHMWDPI